MTLGEKIKAKRKELGLTQTELGKKLGVQTTAVSKWELGRVENIPLSKIKVMAEIFGVEAKWLLGWDVSIEESLETEKAERESGRIDARESMKKAYGVEHQTLIPYWMENHFVILYYHPFESRRSGEAAKNILSTVDEVDSVNDIEGIEKLARLVSAYQRADERTRQIVDLNLAPFKPASLDDLDMDEDEDARMEREARAEADEIYRQLLAERKATAKSSGSGSGNSGKAIG